MEAEEKKGYETLARYLAAALVAYKMDITLGYALKRYCTHTEPGEGWYELAKKLSRNPAEEVAKGPIGGVDSVQVLYQMVDEFCARAVNGELVRLSRSYSAGEKHPGVVCCMVTTPPEAVDTMQQRLDAAADAVMREEG